MTAFRLLLSVACVLHFAVRVNAQELLKPIRVDSIPVMFRNASFDIDQRAQVLKRLKGIRQGQPMKVVLKAYTDTVGTLEANKVLASERMLATWKLVKASAFASAKIDTLNLNEKHGRNPVADPLYRRVDILVYKLEPDFVYGAPINLRILFEGGTAKILPTSIASAEKLLLLMQMDTTLTIELHGHVCCGPEQALSLNRAKSVQDYLVAKGIAASRMTCRGFSNTKPITKEVTEGDQARNRRVEVVFVDPKKAKVAK